MRKKLTRLLMISCLLSAGSLSSVAQEKKPREAEMKVPPDGTFKVLGPKLAIGKVVKGAPYSAAATTETTQTLSDGNQIIRKNESKLYRDSEGRVRTEQTLETIGKWSAEGEANQLITINDPVAGLSFSLDPRARIAQKNFFGPQKTATVEWNENFKVNGQPISKAEFDALMEKKRKTQEQLQAPRGSEASGSAELKKKIEALHFEKKEAGQTTTESLGRQMIEGVEAEGKRTTRTIPAGEIGNIRPIEIVDKVWYAPALQINVMTKHRDPRSGETTYRLTNISRAEPDHSLFEVPADYSVIENKLPLKSKPMKEEQ